MAPDMLVASAVHPLTRKGILPAKAIEAGLKGAHSGSSVLRPCPAPQELSSGTSQGRLPRLTLAHLKAAAAHLRG